MRHATSVYKVIGGLLTIFASMIYILLLYFGYIEWGQNKYIHESTFDELRFLMGTAFGCGMPPLIVAASYFLRLDSIGRLLEGCAVTVAFIVFHFITLNFMAHGTPYIYLTLALIEFFLSVWVALTKLKVQTN